MDLSNALDYIKLPLHTSQMIANYENYKEITFNW